MIFPCDKCGTCCKHIDLIPQLNEYDNGKGRCIHLMTNNLCDIYENRPDICNIEKMYELNYSKYMTEEEYVKLNVEGCREIKNSDEYKKRKHKIYAKDILTSNLVK